MLLLEEIIERVKRGLGFDKSSVFRPWFTYLRLRPGDFTDCHEICNQRTKVERRIYLYLNLHMYNDILFPSRFKVLILETSPTVWCGSVVQTDIKTFIETLFTIL